MVPFGFTGDQDGKRKGKERILISTMSFLPVLCKNKVEFIIGKRCFMS